MANIFSNYGVNYSLLDVSLLVRAQTHSQLYDNINYVYNGITYQDLAEFQYYYGGCGYSADFGGYEITADSAGNISGGTITGYLESVWSGTKWLPSWGIEGVSYSAVSLAATAYTTGNADDLTAIAQMLSGDDRFNMSNYADVFRGYAGNDSMLGNGGNDSLYGDEGNDHLVGGLGNDYLSGGSGIDVAIFTGAMSGYTLSQQGSASMAVTDRIGNRDGVDTLVGIERLNFSDTSIALDVARGQNAGEIYRLYEATFNRVPKPVGEGYWLNKLDNGESLVEIANEFLLTPEFRSIYGESPSDTLYVTTLFQNVLGRAPKQAGLDYYKGWLEQGKTKAEVLVDISESLENVANVVTLIANGIQYTDVG